jgi:DHA1 family tetracycline resistance protein-like MFS transporter
VNSIATNPKKAAIAFIMVTIVLDVLSLGLIIPVGAKLILKLVDGDKTAAAFYIGLFGTTWAFMQFFCSPIMGALSDRFGRRPILVISAFGLGFDYILLALAPNLAWLFLGRIITGITASSFSTAQAYLADVTKPEDRSAAYGMFGAAFGMGFVLGPAMGGWLSDFDLRLPFWVSAFLTLSNAMYGFFVLPESLPIEKRSSFRWARANPLGSLQLLRSTTGLLPMAMTLFLYQLAHQVFQNVFILYTLNRFGWSGAMQGGTLASVGILNFIVQGGLIRPAVKRFGERVLIFVGLSGGILGFLAYSIASTGTMFFASTIIFALMGFFSASIQGVMSKKLDPGQQGQLSGANSSLNGISGMIGPFLFTQVYSWTIDPNVPNAWQGAPFALAAAILGLSLVIAFIYVPKKS